MRKLVENHSLAVATTGLLGLVFILLSALVPSSWSVLAVFFSNTGTACLALAVLEFLYKTLLHEELMSSLVTQFKRAVSLPVKAVYLRRRELPPEQTLEAVFDQAQDVVYLKAISFSITYTGGLLSFIDRALKKHPSLKVRLLVFDPASPHIDFVSTVSALRMPALKHSIEALVGEVVDLSSRHENRVGIAYYKAIPTAGICLVDPERPQAWGRVEPYLYKGQPPAERLNIILERRQDTEYFDQLYHALKADWEQSQQRVAPNDASQPTSSAGG